MKTNLEGTPRRSKKKKKKKALKNSGGKKNLKGNKGIKVI